MNKYLTRHLVAVTDVQVGRAHHVAGAKFYATAVDAEYLLTQGVVKDAPVAPPAPVKTSRVPSPRASSPAASPAPVPQEQTKELAPTETTETSGPENINASEGAGA